MKNKNNIQTAPKPLTPIRVQCVMRNSDGSVNNHPRPSDISYGMIGKY